MSYESYNAFATTVKDEMPRLNYEQQLEILTIVVNAMNRGKKNGSPMSKDDKLVLFNELRGCIKDANQINVRNEYLEYLDERYGV